jgi:hypothetical protein
MNDTKRENIDLNENRVIENCEGGPEQIEVQNSIQLLEFDRENSREKFTFDFNGISVDLSESSETKENIIQYFLHGIDSDNYHLIDFILSNYDQIVRKEFYELNSKELKKKGWFLDSGTILQRAAKNSKDIKTIESIFNERFKEEFSKLLVYKDTDLNKDYPVLIASQEKNVEIFSFFLKKHSEIYLEENEKMQRLRIQDIVDDVCGGGKYGIILNCLELDWFPSSLSSLDLSSDSCDESFIKLKQFLEERDKFHQAITNGNYAEVEGFLTKQTKKTKYLFNKQRKSARSTYNQSLIDTYHVEGNKNRNERYKIYELLLNFGLAFVKEEEGEHINLNELDKIHLERIITSKMKLNQSAVEFLSSISSVNPSKYENKKKVEDLYTQLDKIDEIKPILEVIKYGQPSFLNFMQIIFDFSQDSVCDLVPSKGFETKGTTDYVSGQIHIGAKKGEILLGVLAHELTHMAMQIVFKNKCDPFDKNIPEDYKNIIDRLSKQTSVDDIISRCFRNKVNQWPGELIVRVNHILAHYGETEAKQKLKE